LPPVLVLNGCWSGTATSRFGRDPLSLAVGGLLGRADTVVAGVGEVGGHAAAHVGSALLALLKSGIPVRSALRQAQLAIRDASPELAPYDWAGLCLVGV
jgi:hypothetical protein